MALHEKLQDRLSRPSDTVRISAVIDGLDEVAQDYERKWGVGRLDLLVDDELRTRFRRQQEKLDEAITERVVVEIERHAAAMRRAWETLDRAATSAGHKSLSPEVWEIGLADGQVIAFVRTSAEAGLVAREGRYLAVWTVEEIARLIERETEIGLAKQVFPGALVTAVRIKKPIHWAVGDEIPDLAPWAHDEAC